jgi:hypothetical protein
MYKVRYLGVVPTAVQNLYLQLRTAFSGDGKKKRANISLSASVNSSEANSTFSKRPPCLDSKIRPRGKLKRPSRIYFKKESPLRR